MALRLWYALIGYVRVRIAGGAPERLINLCITRGISLWNLAWRGADLEANLTGRAFLRIRPLARRAGVRVRVLGRFGLPFALRRLGRRRLALFLAVAVVAGLYFLSTLVWFIEVRGPMEAVTAEELLAAAEALGLRPGVPRFRIDRGELARQLILRLPALSWVYVTFHGTRAVVEVVERTLPPPQPAAGPGHVLAARAGVVQDLLVLSGEGRVEVGQTVAAGDLLISGLLSAPAPFEHYPVPGEEPPDPERFLWVQARGRVMAATWYEGYVEVSLEQQLPVRTGQWVNQRLVRLAGREFRVAGPRRIPYQDYEVERQGRTPRLPGRGPALVEFVTLRYFEVNYHTERLTPEQAVREAERLLKDRLLDQIPLHARIVDTQTQVVQETGSFVGVRMQVECLEDIGRFEAAHPRELSEMPGGAEPRTWAPP